MTGTGAAWRLSAMCAAVGVCVPAPQRVAMAETCTDCETGEFCRL